MDLEIAVQDVAGAQTAAAGGADRVELCQALSLGGLTPSAGAIEAAADLDIAVHVLVRPRPGGFVCSAVEVSGMVRDVEAAIDAGAAGVVVGALTADGAALDRHALKALVRAAEGRDVTVHRCVDVLLARGSDPAALVDQLAGLGVRRVLTSGGAPRALAGAGVLEAMTAAGGLQVVAGGGVQPGDVAALAATGVAGVHLSARARAADAGPAGPGGGDDGYDVTDAGLVAAARAAVDALAG